MTDNKKISYAMQGKFGKGVSAQDVQDLLNAGDTDTVLAKIKAVDDDFAKNEAYAPVGLILDKLNKPDKPLNKPDKPKKSKKQEPDETIADEYNRMVEAGIITAEEKFQLLQKSASRKARFATAKHQYPHHPRLWGRAAGLDVNQMVVFCELDPVQQENPDWVWIDQETERRTVEWQREWIDTGKINEVSIAETIGNIAQKWDATDKVPF